jgi:predicted O-linked N-acetylglucosamine transferase (SPINDLY family)
LNNGEGSPELASELYRRLVDHYRIGQLEEAWQLARQYGALAAPSFDSLHLIGTLALQTGRLAEAIHKLGEAVAVNPSSFAAYNDYGIALAAAGNYSLALASYGRSLELAPDFADAHFNLGTALFDQGQLDPALQAFRAAFLADPSHFRALSHSGLVHFCQGDYAKALDRYQAAVALAPDDPFIHAYIGDALRDSQRSDEAIESYDRALKLDPTMAEVSNGRGSALAQLRRFDEALASYETALGVRADFAEAWMNRGNVLSELGRHAEARESYRRSVNLRPQFAEAHYKWADMERGLGDPDTAGRLYDLAMEQNPMLPYLRGTRLHCRMQLCDWRDFDRELRHLQADIESGVPSCPPFALLGLLGSAALQRRAAEIYVEHELGNGSAAPPQRYGGGKIRLGYFSADFCNHPVAHLTAALFETHDRGAFEVLAFSYGQNTGDAMRLRLQRSFDRFIDVGPLSDEEIAGRARAEGIDIAIDLGGFTSNARPGIFAARAAPIQMGYLGYMATSGAPYMDYLIADRLLVPHGARPHVSEKIVYLPVFQANDPHRCVSARRFGSAEFKLPDDVFVYCCFNAPYKITPLIFAAWMRILSRVPRAVLLLYGANVRVTQNLRAAAEKAGIAPDRLVFGAALPLPEYLARFRIADLFLDTAPYNAGTTAADALWMGLPVLTLAGEAPASRMGASLLHACGLDELVTYSLAGYEERAVDLAVHPGVLEELKGRLIAERQQLPLFAIKELTQSLEAAFVVAVERRRQGVPNEDIAADATT